MRANRAATSRCTRAFPRAWTPFAGHWMACRYCRSTISSVQFLPIPSVRAHQLWIEELSRRFGGGDMSSGVVWRHFLPVSAEMANDRARSHVQRLLRNIRAVLTEHHADVRDVIEHKRRVHGQFTL